MAADEGQCCTTILLALIGATLRYDLSRRGAEPPRPGTATKLRGRDSDLFIAVYLEPEGPGRGRYHCVVIDHLEASLWPTCLRMIRSRCLLLRSNWRQQACCFRCDLYGDRQGGFLEPVRAITHCLPICRQSQRLNTSRAPLGAWLVWAPPVETRDEYAQPSDLAVALPPGHD